MAQKTSLAHAFQVGLFVLTALVLMCAVTVIIGFERFFHKTDQYFTYFRSIPRGLQRASVVYLEGVEVGNVHTIQPVYGTNIYIWVTMNINQTAKIDPGYMHVQVIDPLIGGPASLQILTERPEQPPPTIPVDFVISDTAHYLKARAFTRFEAIETQARMALDNLSQLDIVKLQSKFLEVAQGVSQTLYTINQRISDERVDQIMISTEALIARGAMLVSNISQQVDQQSLADTLAYINTTASNFTMVSSRIEHVLPEPRLRAMAANVDRTFTAAPGTLQELRDLSAALQRMAVTLTRVLESVERNPSMLILGKPTPKTDQPGGTQ